MPLPCSVRPQVQVRKNVDIHYAARPATGDFFKASTHKAVKVYKPGDLVTSRQNACQKHTRIMNTCSKGGGDLKLVMYLPSLAACIFSCGRSEIRKTSDRLSRLSSKRSPPDCARSVGCRDVCFFFTLRHLYSCGVIVASPMFHAA